MTPELDALWKLGLALVLSSVIGLERELRQKSAGLRTHTLVGIGAALFMLVGQLGFSAVLDDPKVTLDPSRVVSQIVTGIGFIGAGIIFVRRDAVRGLTTAAGVWTTAAIGAAAGGGLALLATATTAAYLLVAFVYLKVEKVLPRSRWAPLIVEVTYPDGRGLLREIISACIAAGFGVVDVSFSREHQDPAVAPTVRALLELQGGTGVAGLVSGIGEVDGVQGVTTISPHATE
ncbi:MAG TPA: MgtC/SapB family protein [Acidimicrobiia bacterium]